jgi:hypothetical protein
MNAKQKAWHNRRLAEADETNASNEQRQGMGGGEVGGGGGGGIPVTWTPFFGRRRARRCG